MQNQALDWEKIFQSMYLIKDLYTVHIKTLKNKTKNPIKKMDKWFEQTLCQGIRGWQIST